LKATGIAGNFLALRLPTSLRDALAWANLSSEEPLRLVRLAVGGLLLLGTIIALTLALTGAEPRALELVGLFWAIYGFVVGLTSGILEPAIDGLFHLLANFGLTRAGGGYSGIETLVARGHLAQAAEAYRERAQEPGDRVNATLRRAALLARDLDQPETAVVELESLRDGPLPPGDDLRVGLALVQLYEHRVGDPGRAMRELRRLIDRHPDARSVRRLRASLADLKTERFGAPP